MHILHTIAGGYNKLYTKNLHALLYTAHYYQVAELLIKHGADVNLGCRDEDNSAINMAAMEGHIDMLELLKKSGCDMNRGNKIGITAVGSGL